MAQMVNNLPAGQETWVQSPGWEDPLEEGMATHSSILAWRIPWTEEPGRLQPMGSQRVRHDWATNTSWWPQQDMGICVPPIVLRIQWWVIHLKQEQKQALLWTSHPIRSYLLFYFLLLTTLWRILIYLFLCLSLLSVSLYLASTRHSTRNKSF